MKHLITYLSIAVLVAILYACNNSKRPQRPSTQPDSEITVETSEQPQDFHASRLHTPYSPAEESDILRVIDTISGNYAYTIYSYNAPEDSITINYYSDLTSDTLNFSDHLLANEIGIAIDNSTKSVYLGKKSLEKLLSRHIADRFGIDGEAPISILRWFWTRNNQEYFIEFRIGEEKEIELFMSKPDSTFREITHEIALRESYTYESRRIAIIVTDVRSLESDTIIISKNFLYDYCNRTDYYLNDNMALGVISLPQEHRTNMSYSIPFINNDTITFETSMCVPDTDLLENFIYRHWEGGDTIIPYYIPMEGE